MVAQVQCIRHTEHKMRFLRPPICLYPLEIYGVPFMLTKRSSHRTQYGPALANYTFTVREYVDGEMGKNEQNARVLARK